MRYFCNSNVFMGREKHGWRSFERVCIRTGGVPQFHWNLSGRSARKFFVGTAGKSETRKQLVGLWLIDSPYFTRACGSMQNYSNSARRCVIHGSLFLVARCFQWNCTATWYDKGAVLLTRSCRLHHAAAPDTCDSDYGSLVAGQRTEKLSLLTFWGCRTFARRARVFMHLSEF